MPKKDDSGDNIISESGNWNMASDFVKINIVQVMIKCNSYEELALFGYDSILDELINYDQIPNDYIKLVGLKRLIRELIKLIKNTNFSMKASGTKERVKEIESKLYRIEKVIPALYTETFNQINKTKKIMIDYENFNKVLENVLNLKSEINDPLNKNHLIFTDKEEFDPSTFKNRIKDRIINKG